MASEQRKEEQCIDMIATKGLEVRSDRSLTSPLSSGLTARQEGLPQRLVQLSAAFTHTVMVHLVSLFVHPYFLRI